MMLNKRVSQGLALCSLLLVGSLIAQKTVLQGRERWTIAGGEGPSVSQIKWSGEKLELNDTRFGFTDNGKDKPINQGESAVKTSVPDVELIIDETLSIRHFFSTGPRSTTPPFNIFETNEEYTGKSGVSSHARIVLGDGEVTDRKVIATGKKISNDDYSVQVTLEDKEGKDGIFHKYSVTNSSQETKTFYPVKAVDTELAGNDDVAIRSRGNNKGLYIKSLGYRLDYITDVENGPVTYAGGVWISKLTSLFGDNMKKPVSPHPNAPRDEILFGEDREPESLVKNFLASRVFRDSAMYFAWGEVTLKPGETADFEYSVEVKKDAALEIEMEVINQTSSDSNNHIKDQLEYIIPITTVNDSFEAVKIVNELPKEVNSPTEVSIKQADGSSQNYPLEEVYDESNHTLVIPDLLVPKYGSIELHYLVEIKQTAAGKILVNQAVVNGEGEKGDLFEGAVSKELEVLNTGEVFIEYHDEAGKELAEKKDLIGEIGAPYEEAPLDIPEYDYLKVDGSPTGKFTESPQKVKFIYREIPKSGKLVVEYIDEEGQELANSKEINDVIGTAYQEEPLDIANYGYLKTEGKPVGEIGIETKYLRFIYEELPDLSGLNVSIKIENSNVIVHYQNADQLIVSIDGDEYKRYQVTNLPTDKTKILDIPLNDLRNVIHVEARDGEKVVKATYNSQKIPE